MGVAGPKRGRVAASLYRAQPQPTADGLVAVLSGGSGALSRSHEPDYWVPLHYRAESKFLLGYFDVPRLTEDEIERLKMCFSYPQDGIHSQSID